ncbi:MAG: hypothetical protein KBF66_10325 [Rhodoferax sp.]|uniref:hypothetical protein n=1 Tax=Rhodoferax sp. TaxID=50421 RepID=UPI001B5E634E|nr:hypothetical protein [Rhodoferax sp.]MBP9905945.1 hypothetical protein [Rhodoferax sp.]
MNTPSVDVFDPKAQPAGLRYRWLPTLAVEPGMVVARPVVGLTGVRETMYLAMGTTITGETIAQMVVKGVECVAVVDASAANPDDDASARECFRARLDEIFGPTPDAGCQPLVDALMLAQHTLC